MDYTLDPVGNRLNRVSNLPGVAAAASTFDANDRLLSDTSDDNGNTLASEKGTDEYDFENRLLKRTKPDRRHRRTPSRFSASPFEDA